MRGVISSFLGRALRSGSTLRCVAPYATVSYPPPWGRQPSRSESEEKDPLKPKDVVLFQYGECPVCNKVSAVLDYFEIPYIDVKVTPITKKEIKWSANKQLPIFVVDAQPTRDSSDLINKLVKRMQPDYDLNADEEKKWREWVDNYLVHVVSANRYRTFSKALEAFEYVAPEAFKRYRGAVYEYLGYLPLSKRLERLATMYGGDAAMYYSSKILKKKHNIIDERAALYGAVEQWVDALKGRKFLGGSNNPNLADLAVFGALRSIRYLSLGVDMVQHTRIQTWYSDMEWLVLPASTSSADSSREVRLNSGDFYDEEFAKKDVA